MTSKNSAKQGSKDRKVGPYESLKSFKSKNGVISSLRCVCVCEVAVNSKGVKTTQKSKSVPDTYLVVTNDDSVIGKVYNALQSNVSSLF